MSEGKTCTRCGERLPFEAFVIDRRNSTGRGAHCRACERARVLSHYYNGAAEEKKARQRARYDPEKQRQRYAAGGLEKYRAWRARVREERERTERFAPIYDATGPGRRLREKLDLWRGRIAEMDRTGERSLHVSCFGGLFTVEYSLRECRRLVRGWEADRAEAIRRLEKQTRLREKENEGKNERRKAA